jgi:hypothetical protein
MRWATILMVAAALTAVSGSSALAQMAFPTSSTVANEVLIEIRNSTNRHTINALLRRHRLTGLETHRSRITGTTVYRGHIRGHRSLANVVRSLKAEAAVASAQPNYVFRQQ